MVDGMWIQEWMSKEEAKQLGKKRITIYYINYNFVIKRDKNAAFGYSLKAFRVGLHRHFLAIFLKPPFYFAKRQFDFCRFCWSHRPKSVVLFAKLKFRKVK